MVRGSQDVPVSAAAHLARESDHIARKNLGLLGELVRLMRALDDHGIEALCYKGPTLALWLAGDVGVRQFSDLDILVRGGDVIKALPVLAHLGYESAVPLSELRAGALPSEGQVVLRHDGSGVVVELHWQLVQQYFRVGISPEDLIGRSVQRPVGGVELRTPSPEDLLILLCVHHTKHRWERLQWIAEVASIYNHSDRLGVSLELAFERAATAGALRMMRLGAAISRTLWRIELPAWIEASIGDDPGIPALVDDIVDRLATGEGRLSEIPERISFQSRSRDTRADRARMHAVRTFSATMADRRAFKLPRWLSSLYIVLRPLRLVATRLVRIMRRSAPPTQYK